MVVVVVPKKIGKFWRSDATGLNTSETICENLKKQLMTCHKPSPVYNNKLSRIASAKIDYNLHENRLTLF